MLPDSGSSKKQFNNQKDEAEQREFALKAGAELRESVAEAFRKARKEGVVHATTGAGNYLALGALLRLQPSLACENQVAAGYTPLHVAAMSREEGVVECASLLLEHGAPIETKLAANGETPLRWAATCSNERVARLLLCRGADPAAAAAGGSTALHMSCGKGDEAIVRLLLEYNAPLEATREGSITPLFDAIRATGNPARAAGGIACIRLLLAHGADANGHVMVPHQGEWPLIHYAVRTAPAEVVQLLIDAGADVNSMPTTPPITPLLLAVLSKRPEMVALLLRAGADLDLESGGSLRPMEPASTVPGAAPCLRELLLHRAVRGANGVEWPGPEEEQALRRALGGGHTVLTEVLLGLGAQPEGWSEWDDEDAPEPAEYAPQVIAALPGAIAIAQQQLDALPQAPGSTLREAVALFETRLAAAVTGAGGDCALARLQLLRAGGLPWWEAWKHVPLGTQRFRFSGAVDRLARAQALLACAEKAEAAAAARTVSVLRQLSEAENGSREREKLLYAAATCVTKWWDVKQAAADEAASQLSAAERCIDAARAQGEETLAWLQKLAAAGPDDAVALLGWADDDDSDDSDA